MINIARAIARDPARWLIIPAAAWIGLAFFGPGPLTRHQMPAMLIPMSEGGAQTLEMVAMIVAMMLPLAVPQLEHLSVRARRNGVQAALYFACAYCSAWLAVCILLGAIASVAERLLGSRMLLVLCTFLIAACWQETPLKRAAIRRGRHLPPMRSEGIGLVADSCALGVTIGHWCAVSCWPWMLLCAVLGHSVPAMFALGSMLWFECYGLNRPMTLRGLIPVHVGHPLTSPASS